VKVIYIIADTLRRDHVSVYGDAPWKLPANGSGKIHTPNLERLASEAAVFENAHIGSFPTGPNRRDTALGHGDKGLPFNRWRTLDSDEVTFPRLLAQNDIPSMLITDTQNTVTRNLNLYRDFSAWTLIRGQEGDRCWMDDSVPLEFPVPHELIRYRAEMWHQILTNRAHRRLETDWFAPQTYRVAIDWLESNYRRKDFFLWIDTFDPHEPWDPPQHYVDTYDPGYTGRVIEAPPAGLRRKMGITDHELTHIRACYAGEVTMVDAWLGHLLDKLERLGILDECLILFTSDHGNPLAGPGDFGLVRKPVVIGADGTFASAGRPAKDPKRFFPLSLNTTRIPLIVRLPDMKKTKRIKGIVQPWDVAATILDAFGVRRPSNIIGRSLLPLIGGKTKKIRDAALSGNNDLAQFNDGRWLYAVRQRGEGRWLFDLRSDPNCEKNAAAKQSKTASRLHGRLAKAMREWKIGEEFIAGYDA